MLSPLTSATPEHLQLGCGVLLTNLDVNDDASPEQLREAIARAMDDGRTLGVTRGGGRCVCKPLLRQLDADGLRAPRVGLMSCDGWTCRLTATLLELSPDNLTMALACATQAVDRITGRTMILPRAALSDQDFIPRVTWVGDTGSGLMMIDMRNVLNLSGAALTFNDRGEGELPVELQPHLGRDDAPGALPFRISLLTEATA